MSRRLALAIDRLAAPGLLADPRARYSPSSASSIARGPLAVVGRAEPRRRSRRRARTRRAPAGPVSTSRAVTCSPVVTIAPPSIASTSSAEVDAARGARGRSPPSPVRSRWSRISSSRPSSPDSNSILPREHVDRGLEVDRPRHRLVLALPRGPVQRRGGDRLGARDREPRAHAAALVDRARLAQRPGEPGQDLDEVVGHLGDERRPPAG